MAVTVTTTNVLDNTVLYWSTSNITTTDPDFAATTGTTTIAHNSGSFSVTAVADSTTEGAETFGITLRSGSQSGPIVASTTNKTINDTSLNPSYSASSASNINEGSALGVTVTTTHVPDGTTLYWTTNHTTTDAADFSSNSGSFTITNNSAVFTVPVVADTTTEGSETFTVQIRTTSTSGTIVATLPSITVNDTSIAGIYLDGSRYVHKRYNKCGNSGNAFAAAISTDGTKAFIMNNNGVVQASTLSTAWDVSTFSSDYSLTILNATTDPNPRCLTFKPDGTVVWISNSNSGAINQYNLSTAWDLRTMSLDGSYDFRTNYAQNPADIRFSSDGTKAFVLDISADRILRFDLNTAWDITDGWASSYQTSIEFDLTTTLNESVVRGFAFSNDGNKLYLVGNTNDRLYTYHLSTPWDISSSSLSGREDDGANTALYETGLMGVFLSPDGLYLYTVGQIGDGFDMFERSTLNDSTADLIWDARDYSGSGNWIDSVNNVGLQLGNGTWWDNNFNMPRFYLDGYNNLLYSSSSNSLWHFGNGDFTVELWFKVNSTSGRNTIFSIRNSVNHYSPLVIEWYGSNLRAYMTKTNGSWNVMYASSIGTVSTGNWYHVVITRSGNTYTKYFNGSSAGSFTNSGSLYNNGGRLNIGEYTNSAAAFASVCRIHKGTALTGTQVLENYNAQLLKHY